MSSSTTTYATGMTGMTGMTGIVDGMTRLDPDLAVAAVMAGCVVLRTVTDASVTAITRALALVCGGVAAYLVREVQAKRDAGAKDVASRFDALEGTVSIRDPAAAHRIDGERYSQRVAAPTADLPLRALRRRPDVAHALSKLLPHVRADRGAVTRVLTVLEDFYARMDTLQGAGAAAVARNLRLLQDARADALNALASLEWTVPTGARSAGAIRRARTRVQRQTLEELRALSDRHARSPQVQAADWRPPYAVEAANVWNGSSGEAHLYL